MPCSACANARRRSKPYAPLSAAAAAKIKSKAKNPTANKNKKFPAKKYL